MAGPAPVGAAAPAASVDATADAPLRRAMAEGGGSRADARSAPAEGEVRPYAARSAGPTRKARRIADLLAERPLFWRPRLTQLLRAATDDDLASLSVAQRAKAVTALQEGPTVEAEERAIARVFLASAGADLTALKNRVDAGDHNDMVQLIHDDIDEADIRASLLAHFAAQAGPRPGPENKVLSDIDDTLKASINDKRYPKGTVYPGVRQLYLELDLGGAGAGRVGDLGFLTARPEIEGLAEDLWTRQTLKDAGLGHVTILSGDLAHAFDHDAMAEKKAENFRAYHGVFPEYGVVFIGDSGQGDEAAGRAMLAGAPDHVRGVFIHDLDGTKPKDAGGDVIFFDTYVGAAVQAHARGLISDQGLARVAAVALQEQEAVPFKTDAQREHAQALLQADLAKAAAALGEH
ncbi:MAG: DUF2183 domain-containing protein [Deltaproteobacteria bacterium]|nr:DUF2183 domain-containing protein [Deltaproteobacteria bacterium]